MAGVFAGYIDALCAEPVAFWSHSRSHKPRINGNPRAPGNWGYFDKNELNSTNLPLPLRPRREL